MYHGISNLVKPFFGFRASGRTVDSMLDKPCLVTYSV